MLGSNLRYMQRGYEYRSLLEFFSSAMKVMLPENGLLWFGTVFAAVYMGRRIWRGEGEARDRILLWWVFWSFAVLWISGTFFYHYFLQTRAFLCIGRFWNCSKLETGKITFSFVAVYGTRGMDNTYRDHGYGFHWNRL